MLGTKWIASFASHRYSFIGNYYRQLSAVEAVHPNVYIQYPYKRVSVRVCTTCGKRECMRIANAIQNNVKQAHLRIEVAFSGVFTMSVRT